MGSEKPMAKALQENLILQRDSLYTAEDGFSGEALRARLGADGEKWSFEFHSSLSSTNTQAVSRAEANAPEGLVVFADGQQQGRGRMGRCFFSPPGAGLYMSVLLRPRLDLRRVPQITAFAAVAVARAVERLSGAEVGIKWVNDLFVNGKKICGILTEAGFGGENGGIRYAVIGIGVNVRRGEFPETLRRTAASIEEVCGRPVERCALAAEILRELAGLETEVQSGNYLSEYRARSVLLGRRVTVINGKDSFSAIAREIDENAALVVETEDGQKKTVFSGEVSVRWQ